MFSVIVREHYSILYVREERKRVTRRDLIESIKERTIGAFRTMDRKFFRFLRDPLRSHREWIIQFCNAAGVTPLTAREREDLVKVAGLTDVPSAGRIGRKF